ncbi:MAG: alpha/beta hydrolase [Pseudohongiellaceae bacterium]
MHVLVRPAGSLPRGVPAFSVGALLLRCSLTLLLVGMVTNAVAQALQPVAAPRPDGLETVSFYSPAVAREMKFDIVLPPDYADSERRYPVLYLLHGHLQNYTVWGRSLGAAEVARRLGELILVLPDGGNSWFVNYAASGDGQRNNWEDHVVVDVVDYVDSHYRTEARAEGRAIAGLSMGGFAALAIGLRHPQQFVSLGSTSGALGHARSAAAAIRAGLDRSPAPLPEGEQFARADQFVAGVIAIPGFGTQAERTPAGTDFLTAEQAEAYDPFTIIYEVPRSAMPHIYLDAGTADPLIAQARELAQLLMINIVPFEFRQDQGGHTADYWRRSIGSMMAVQNEVMQRALGNR